jgi:hypothetical protein
VHSFSGSSPAGFMTKFYCLNFETPPTCRDISLYSIPPRKSAGQLYPGVLGSQLSACCSHTYSLGCCLLTPCDSSKENRHFGGKCRFCLQDNEILSHPNSQRSYTLRRTEKRAYCNGTATVEFMRYRGVTAHGPRTNDVSQMTLRLSSSTGRDLLHKSRFFFCF